MLSSPDENFPTANFLSWEFELPCYLTFYHEVHHFEDSESDSILPIDPIYHPFIDKWFMPPGHDTFFHRTYNDADVQLVREFNAHLSVDLRYTNTAVPELVLVDVSPDPPLSFHSDTDYFPTPSEELNSHLTRGDEEGKHEEGNETDFLNDSPQPSPLPLHPGLQSSLTLDINSGTQFPSLTSSRARPLLPSGESMVDADAVDDDVVEMPPPR